MCFRFLCFFWKVRIFRTASWLKTIPDRNFPVKFCQSNDFHQFGNHKIMWKRAKNTFLPVLNRMHKWGSSCNAIYTSTIPFQVKNLGVLRNRVETRDTVRNCSFKITFGQFLVKRFWKFLLFRNFAEICFKFLFCRKYFQKNPCGAKFSSLFFFACGAIYLAYRPKTVQNRTKIFRLRRKIDHFLGSKFLFFEVFNPKFF